MVMAEIYMICGQYEEAIDQLDEVLSLGTVVTVNDVKMNELFKPLHDNPRYQELFERYQLPRITQVP